MGLASRYEPACPSEGHLTSRPGTALSTRPFEFPTPRLICADQLAGEVRASSKGDVCWAREFGEFTCSPVDRAYDHSHERRRKRPRTWFAGRSRGAAQGTRTSRIDRPQT